MHSYRSLTCALVVGEVGREGKQVFPVRRDTFRVRTLDIAKHAISRLEWTTLGDWRFFVDLPGELGAQDERERWLMLWNSDHPCQRARCS